MFWVSHMSQNSGPGRGPQPLLLGSYSSLLGWGLWPLQAYGCHLKVSRVFPEAVLLPSTPPPMLCGICIQVPPLGAAEGLGVGGGASGHAGRPAAREHRWWDNGPSESGFYSLAASSSCSRAPCCGGEVGSGVGGL